MSMWRDIRVALRPFLRAPAATAIALLSIALSVGAAAVVLAGIKAVLIAQPTASGAKNAACELRRQNRRPTELRGRHRIVHAAKSSFPLNGLLIRTPRISWPSFRSSVY